MLKTKSVFYNTAVSIGLNPDHLEPYGNEKGKVSLAALAGKEQRGKLILVSAMTPTPAGEGKTTVSIGLAQGLKKIGKSVALALRQPSMGPVFGRKGGATGGGKSTLVPAQSINLHFNGDFHAITAAHNLLSAVIENQLFYRTSRLDPRKVSWKRVIDMNDRSLRSMIVGLRKNSFPRESSFDITPASEVMAAMCLAESIPDLRGRLNRMVVGFTADDLPVFAEEMKCTGAMLVLLKDAMMPNLVQSVEGVPAFLHGGPFANIAHGCNSIIATRMALAYADYAVTEAGFAFDLGAEKFLNIKCRQAGFSPDAAVIVATIRALKMHGGKPLGSINEPDAAAVEKGLENLAAHLNSAEKFKLPVVVALNKFSNDTAEELKVVHEFCNSRGVRCATADVFGKGGEGAKELATLITEAAGKPRQPFHPLYRLEESAEEKIRIIATQVYGADGVNITVDAAKKLAMFERCGFGGLPICMAKTQNSISDDPKLLGRPKGFRITVRDFEIANGPGFIVALTGDILRMPALPKEPAAERIDLDDEGRIIGV